MKRIATVLISAGVLALTAPSLAHNGEDHSGGHGEAHQQGSNGGTLKEGKNLNLELMTMKMGIAVFPVGKDGKNIPIAEVTLKGTAEIGKQPPIPVELNGMGNHFMANFTSKEPGAITLRIQATKGGQTEKFTFKVEQSK